MTDLFPSDKSILGEIGGKSIIVRRPGCSCAIFGIEFATMAGVAPSLCTPPLIVMSIDGTPSIRIESCGF